MLRLEAYRPLSAAVALHVIITDLSGARAG